MHDVSLRSDALKLWSSYRAADWVQYLGLPFLGALEAPPVRVSGLWAGTAIAAALLAYAYALNDRFDAPAPDISWTRVAAPLGLVLVLWPLLSDLQRISALLFTALVSAYSLPGLRWSALPVLGTASNATGFTLLLGLGAGTLDAGFWMLAATLIAVQAGAQLVHEWTDCDEDQRSGRRTTMSLLGPVWTSRMVAFCFGTGTGVAAWHSPWLAAVMLTYTLVVAWWLVKAPSADFLRSRVRLAGRFVGAMIFVGLIGQHWV